MQEKKQTKAAVERELKALRKECLRLWKAVVKFKAGHKCEFPGCKKKGYLCAHHVESYSVNKTLRYIIENGVAFCLTHHKFGRISAHKSFIMMHLFMLEHKRKNLKFLIEHYRDKEDLSKEYLVKQIAFLSSLLPEKKVKTKRIKDSCENVIELK